MKRGNPTMPPEPPTLPDEAARVGRAMSGTVDLAGIVRNALEALRNTY